VSVEDFRDFGGSQGDTESYSSREQPTPPAQSRRGRGGLIAAGAVLGTVLVAFAAGAGGLYYFGQSYEGKVYPNISIQGIPVGELPPSQAQAAIEAQYADYLKNPVTITFEHHTWNPTAEELGIKFNFDEVADQAYQAGRGNHLINNIQYVANVWQNGLDLPVQVTFDQNKMQQYISAIRDELDVAPRDARLQVTDLTVSMQIERYGRQILVDDTVQDLTKALQSFTPGSQVVLRSRELAPRLHDEDVLKAKQQVETILSGDVELTVEDKTFTWTPQEIALMLEISRVPKDEATDTIKVELNPYHIEKRIKAIADQTGRGSVHPRVAWNNGNLRIIRPGTPGIRVDEQQAFNSVIAAITSNNRSVSLPTTEVAPAVTEENLNQIGINELVSVGRSDFSGSAAYRIHNVVRGMEILNGILIAPGEEFSFNDNIGNIDASNGFVEGYAIVQNRTQLEYGGGICQDSTTVFRAAFWAGLPITERWTHSYYISWYDRYGLGAYGDGMGLDAAIFTGALDLKFVNDTGNWLLLQAWANPTSGVAQVELYGTKPNRTVEIKHSIYDRIPAPTDPVYVPDREQPVGTQKQTDTARGGMTIDVQRTIYDNGVARDPQLFRTRFKAWPNIFSVNPADLGPDGKPLPKPEPEPEPEAEQPQPEQPAPEQPQPEQPAPEQPQPEQPAQEG
jgi:vancomycin resistance protein YoaR